MLLVRYTGLLPATIKTDSGSIYKFTESKKELPILSEFDFQYFKSLQSVEILKMVRLSELGKG